MRTGYRGSKRSWGKLNFGPETRGARVQGPHPLYKSLSPQGPSLALDLLVDFFLAYMHIYRVYRDTEHRKKRGKKGGRFAGFGCVETFG